MLGMSIVASWHISCLIQSIEEKGHIGTTDIDNERPDGNLVHAAACDAMMRTTADWVAKEERLAIIEAGASCAVSGHGNSFRGR